MEKNKVTTSAPGKLLLLGDHAVVYGHPCLVTAVNYRVFTEVSVADKDEFIFPEGNGNSFIQTALELFREKFNKTQSIRVKTWANYKESYGLGSSSAVTVAFIKALSELFLVPLSKKELFDLCYEVVLKVQGVGSGFDIAAAIWGGTLLFVTGGKKIKSYTGFIEDLPLIVAYSGSKGNTPELVKKVAKRYKEKKKDTGWLFEQLAEQVEWGKDGLISKNYKMFGYSLRHSHTYLRDLGISTPKLDELVETAQNAGAYGAKLSGAGGGDCIIAIAPEEKRKQVEKSLEKAGGTILSVKTNEGGVRVEQQVDDQGELFVVVDKNDKVLGYRTRHECHTDKSLIHRGVQVGIFNNKDKILLQKRSLKKDLYPGMFTLSATGHVNKNEDYEDTAKREVQEELGIQASVRYLTKYLIEKEKETEMVALFKSYHAGPFYYNKDEIDGVAFYSKEQVKKMKNKLTPSAQRSLQELHFL